MYKSINSATCHQWLDVLLELKRQPVGIRFLHTQEEYAASLSAERESPLPYCRAVQNATQGDACKFGLAQIACLSGARVLGLLSAEEDFIDQRVVTSGKRHCDMGMYCDYCISRQVAKDMTYCQHHVKGIEVAPLSHYKNTNPDVVIVVGNSVAMMRIIQGYAFFSGHLKNIKMVGNQALCQECTSYPFEENCVNISMMCAGTRKASKWGNDEIAAGIPFNQLAKIIEGIKETANLMDDNAVKKGILERAQKYHLQSELAITFNSNYYTGGFGTLDYHKSRQLKQQPKT